MAVESRERERDKIESKEKRCEKEWHVLFGQHDGDLAISPVYNKIMSRMQ